MLVIELCLNSIDRRVKEKEGDVDTSGHELDRLRAENAELRRALAHAERETGRLRRIIEVLPGAVWDSTGTPATPGYQLHFVSGQVESVLGYTPQECSARPDFWTSITHPDDRALVGRGLAQLAQTGGKLPAFRFVAKDGRSVWVDTYIKLVHDELGAVVGRSVVAVDVTERVVAESSRLALARRLDSLIERVPGIVWETRATEAGVLGAPVFASDFLATTTGYLPREIIDEPRIWWGLIHPDDRARVAGEIATLEASGSGSLTCRWITKDERTIWVETHVRALRDEGSKAIGAYGVTMEVTARKQSEADHERLKDEVIQAQEAMLTLLSTPIIPISNEVLALPLIGALDDRRAARMLEALLHSVRDARARFVLLDLTGVPTIDVATGDALSRAARAVRLLGAEVVLTGVRPEVAANLVELGIDLGGIAVQRTLASGVAHIAKRLR